MKIPFISKTDTIQQVKVPCLLKRSIGNGRYLLDKRLGEGGFSVVYRAIDVERSVVGKPPRFVAVKCVLSAYSTHNWHEFNHHNVASSIRNVVNFIEFIEDKDSKLAFAVMEYCPAGDLFKTITDNDFFFGCENAVRKIFMQILDAVSALHDRGIFHRDLKTENFLMTSDLQSVRLTDFGLATASELSKTLRVGTLGFMSPACLSGSYKNGVEGYSTRANDIWALGVILINLLVLESPWGEATDRDSSFRAFKKHKGYLESRYPFSPAIIEFCDMIFKSGGEQMSVKNVREDFMKIDQYYMTEAEVAKASRQARNLWKNIPRSHKSLEIEDVEDAESSNSSAEETDSIASGKQSVASGSSNAKSDVTSVPTDETGSEALPRPVTRPVSFVQRAKRLLKSPVIGEPRIKSPRMPRAFHKRMQIGCETGGVEVLPKMDNLAI